MALVNRHVLVEYDVGGATLFHERWAVEHVRNDEYVVITPDEDVYVEELGLFNSDLRSVRVRPGNGALPAGVAAGQVYGLPAWGPNDVARLREAARRLADQERAGGPQPSEPVLPAPQMGSAPPALQALGGHERVPPPVGSEGHAAGTLKWLAAEAEGGFAYGQDVLGVGAGMAKGAKVVHGLPTGSSIYVMCVDGADFQAFMQRPSTYDPRVLPMVLNALRQPERTLKDVAAQSLEREMPWQLTGPRTARWCVNYLAIEGLSFEGHHERLRQITKADSSSWGIQEHFQTSMSLRTALLVDQLDPYNLLSVEIQFRRLQTIEFSYSERAKEAEAKAVGGRLSLEERSSFGGITRQYATLMICPELLEHVKLETEKEASLAKNLRKAREEREAARKGGKKGGRDAENP